MSDEYPEEKAVLVNEKNEESEKNAKNEEDENSLSFEDRVQAILYQYVMLYERWSEDRQVFTKHLSDQNKAIKNFSEWVEKIGTLEKEVKSQLIRSINRESEAVAEKIGAIVGKSANQAVERSADILDYAVKNSVNTLEDYKRHVKTSQLKIIGIAISSSVLSSLLIFKLLMPAPVVPITEPDVKTLINGYLLKDIWQKLPGRTKRELNSLAEKTKNKTFFLPGDLDSNKS